jgi:hypothetical protein
MKGNSQIQQTEISAVTPLHAVINAERIHLSVKGLPGKLSTYFLLLNLIYILYTMLDVTQLSVTQKC